MDEKQQNYAVYDVETISNLFTACFKDFNSCKRKAFIIHESHNDLKSLYSFLCQIKADDYYMVGFNNVSFDGQVVHYIMQNYSTLRQLPGREVAEAIYKEAQRVITVPEKERHLYNIPEWNLCIPQLDLYKQKHYDGKAKRTSLKWLEFTMRLSDIEEMPLPHDKPVSEAQIEDILSYNWNDVEATYEFFKRNLYETELRLKLSKQFGVNLLNASEPRMAREILAKLLSEDMNISTKELKEKRTWRKEIHLGKCIIPRVKFLDEQFNELVAKLKATTINANNTKGCFSHSMRYKGIDIEYGVGGIHGAVASGVYSSDEDWVIKTVDVTSFYPNMMINYGFIPAHLGNTFASRYKWFFTERQKIAKKDPINYIYKIILNSTYGLSNDMNSFLYDTLVTMKTTINGQLLLSMLAESLSGIPDSQLLMMNTDGLEIRMQRKHEQEFINRCRVWEELTDLQLEHDEYEKMIIGDVNNYIGVFGKKQATLEEWTKLKEIEPSFLFGQAGEMYYYHPVKLKGRFELKLDYHKNPSGLIITRAIYDYLVKNVPVEHSIKTGSIYDYCFGVKKKADFELMLHKVVKGQHVKERQQRVTRYYMSADGHKLVKQFHDGRIVSVSASALVTPMNRIKEDILPLNLDYKFYTNEAYKEINNIIGEGSNQLTLF